MKYRDCGLDSTDVGGVQIFFPHGFADRLDIEHISKELGLGESLKEARIPTFKKSDGVKDGHKFTVELFKDLNSEPEYQRFDSEEEARKFADEAANSGEYHSLQIMNSDSVGGGWCIDNWSKAKGWNSTLNEDRKTDIESTLLDGEPDFAEYMRDTYGIDIYDDEIADNPDVEDYYLSDYENYLDHLYDLDNDSYDADHAAEWMERNPHGYYNNEGDYGVEQGEDNEGDYDSEQEEDTDVDPEQFLSSYELRRDMTPEEAEAQIKKVFDDMFDMGAIGQEDYARGTEEVYDYWQKLRTTNEALTEAKNKNYRVELYYYDNNKPDDVIYFENTKAAYNFCNNKISDNADYDDGLTGILVFNEVKNKLLNTWQNGSRGWENKSKALAEGWNKKKVKFLNIPYTQLVSQLEDEGIDLIMDPDPIKKVRRYLVDRTGISMMEADKIAKTVVDNAYEIEDDMGESLNEAQFSNVNSNDDIRLVKASYDHFMNDLGEIPSPDDILYDILDNYNQDIFQEGGPMVEGKEIEAIKSILRSQGLEYRGDLDESKNDTLNQDI